VKFPKVDKALLLGVGIGASLLLGLGGLVWWERGSIDEGIAARDALREQTETARKLLAKTPGLEREVIVQRETDAAMRQILPSDRDITEYVRTLQSFAERSSVSILELKKKGQGRDDKQSKVDFEKVGYEITFAGDAFQLLSFLDLVESHARFMSVNTLKLSAAKRNHARRGEDAPAEAVRHEIKLEVETYVYQPSEGGKPVDIEAYERKRDLLDTEISKQRAALQSQAYEYRGPRGRRDPWVDPRMPKQEGDAGRTVADQIRVVEEVSVLAGSARTLWERMQRTQSPIEQMTLERDFVPALAALRARVEIEQTRGEFTYPPAREGWQRNVLDVLTSLSGGPVAEPEPGPSLAVLQEALAKMTASRDEGDYRAVVETYANISNSLELAAADPGRGALVTELREIEEEARTVLDFEQIVLSISGVIIDAGKPFAIINGETVEVGEALGAGLVVHAIREDEIDFEYRGLILSRPVGQ
jgi:hypothetical protein